MFKPTPDTTFQQLLDRMMCEFCEAYYSCCKHAPLRMIIETDHVLPEEITFDGKHYYMLDFTDDNGQSITDNEGNRIVCWISDTNDYSADAATYTQAVKLLEDIAQKEQKHITKVYVESF